MDLPLPTAASLTIPVSLPHVAIASVDHSTRDSHRVFVAAHTPASLALWLHSPHAVAPLVALIRRSRQLVAERAAVFAFAHAHRRGSVPAAADG